MPRQHRFKPDRAISGIGKGQALGIDVLRIVRGNDDVDRAVGSAWTIASRSSSPRSGGDSLKKVRYSPMSFSFSDRWLIETPQVTFAPPLGARDRFRR